MIPQNQRAFVSLVAVLYFMMVISFLIAAFTAQTVFMSAQSYRDTLKIQAYWLAESAFPRAFRYLDAHSAQTQHQQQFSLELFPQYIGEDPLQIEPVEVSSYPRTLQARYGYELLKMQPETIPPELWAEGLTYYLVKTQASIPYRSQSIQKSLARICWKDAADEWHSLPIVP